MSENISSLVEEGLFDSVEDLLQEYSKLRQPTGYLIHKIFQSKSTGYTKLLDFLLLNHSTYHPCFKDYLHCFKLSLLDIIKSKIHDPLESEWIRLHLKQDYSISKDDALLLKVDFRHLLMYLRSIFKTAKQEIVYWFELISIVLDQSVYEEIYMDQMSVLMSNLDVQGIIEFTSLFSCNKLKMEILDFYLQGLSCQKVKDSKLDLQKISKYFKVIPRSKNSRVYTTCLGLLVINWIQEFPKDLQEINWDYFRNSDLKVMAPLFV